MIKKNFTRIAFLFLSILSVTLQAQPGQEKPEQWKDLKFSMFIHWGIYSELGGVWEGKPISKGLSEQIQAHAGIYSDTYAQVAKRFNPMRWSADSIVLLAKTAGMRSVVFTSKHHDGFCMFKSAYTDFNVVDATPFKRDIVKELSESCARHGLRFGIYFSLIDWHFPQASPISSHNSDYITPEHHEYNKNQITELLSNYGTISELWFDMGSQSIQQSKELRDLVHKLQPDCLVSSRLGNDMGDFTVMGDNQEPDYRIGVPWQSPASFFGETWGYRSWQARGDENEKLKEKLASLIRVASRGGNYLLNIGPKGDGSVVDFEKNVLLKMGQWLQKNNEAIYGTQSDPFYVSFDWGSITSRPHKLYLHILSTPKNNLITLPGLKGSVAKAYFLEGEGNIQAHETVQGINLNLPENFSIQDEYKVIVVEFKNDYRIAPPNIVPEQDKKITLNTNNAFKYFSSSCIDYNTRFRSTVKESWPILPKHTGKYIPYLYYSAEEKGKDIDLTINGNEQHVLLDHDESIELKNDLTSCTWQSPYLIGPFWSGLEGTEGDIKNIQVGKRWPDANGMDWKMLPDSKNGKPHTLSGEMMTAYYFLQQIISKKDQSILLKITSGDGVVVFVNGHQHFIYLDPTKENKSENTLLIPLKEGNNQLLIKLFNNFQKTFTFSIHPLTEQVMYRKKLEHVLFNRAAPSTISLKLHEPLTQHQDLFMPNFLVEFVE
ncbi:MAG: alpha-L-fucosidase [Chryseolinea sp.]